LVKWHVRSYRLGLEKDLPVFTAPWHPEEEFRIGDFVALLCEILHLFDSTTVRRNSKPTQPECFCGDRAMWGRGDTRPFMDMTWRTGPQYPALP